MHSLLITWIFDFWTQGGAQNPDFKPKRDTEVLTLSSGEKGLITRGHLMLCIRY